MNKLAYTPGPWTNHPKPSAEGRAPRTLYDAFPENPTGLVRERPRTWRVVLLDMVGLALYVATFGVIAIAGVHFFGVI